MKIPYYKRPDLTNEEIHAVGCYQDLINPQSKWEHSIPKNKSVGRDCYMINNVMRKTINPSINDFKQANKYIYLINSAISKYSTSNKTLLFRGYSNPADILTLNTGEQYYEDSFVSSSSSIEIAEYYATKHKNIPCPVISACVYEKDTPMLYLDDNESEWLLQPSKYKILKIREMIIGGTIGKLYNIKREII